MTWVEKDRNDHLLSTPQLRVGLPTTRTKKKVRLNWLNLSSTIGHIYFVEQKKNPYVFIIFIARMQKRILCLALLLANLA